MNKYNIFLIVIAVLSVLLLTYPADAFEDGFQYYPGGDASANWQIIGDDSYGITTRYATYNRVAYYTASVSTPNTHKDGQITSRYLNSNYISFYLNSVMSGNYCYGSGTYTFNRIEIYDVDGVQATTYDMQVLGNNYIGVFEITVSGSSIFLRINGIDQGVIGSSSKNIGYIIFSGRAFVGGGGGDCMRGAYVDDFSTTGYVTGMGTESTSHILTESNLNPTNISYILNTFPFADYTSSSFRNVIQKYTGSTSQTIITTNIKNASNTSVYHGFTNYNRELQLTSNDTNYGLYFSYLQKNNVTVASDYFFLVPPGAVNSITTPDTSIVIGQTEPITYSIGAPDFIGSTYSVNIYSLSALVTSIPISSATGTVDWDTSGNSNGLYFITLSKTASGIQTDLAYTTVTLVSTLLIKGKVYNAQNATTISGASINVSQGGSWFNATSDSSGNYNLSGLFISLNTNINASKSGYTHNNFSFTPLAAQVYTINLYMIANNLNCSVGASTNTCIVGMVENYPYHQAIPSATVNIGNGSYFTTTTSNATTGFYIFQNLADDNLTYVVNATKANYQNSPDYNVTTINQTFKTRIIIMYEIFTLTIVAQDSTNANTILNFITTFNGTLYNTTVGTISIPNIIYGQYPATVSSTGYLTSSQTILVDSTKTKVFILTPVTPATSSTVFKTVPHNVRFLVQDYAGNPYTGVQITVQGFSTTVGSWSWLSSLLGIDFATTPINNASMTGTTGIDGSVSFMMIDTVYYRVNFNGGSNFNITWNLYPKEDFYILLVSLSLPNTGCANNITANLTATTINSTHTALGLTYLDPTSTTTLINFFVQNNQSVTIYNTNATNSSWSPSYTVNSSVLGTTYFWGFNATVIGCNRLSQTQVITFRGSGRFIDLHIPDIYYQWISIFLIVFVAALFSIKKMKFGAVLVPIVAGIVWVFGWFIINPLILAIALVLGIMTYLRMSEQKVMY